MVKETVKVYSTPTCHWCVKVKEFLKQHKVKFEDINVATDAKSRDYMVKISGQMGVPVIEIGKKIIVGFDEDELSSVLGL